MNRPDRETWKGETTLATLIGPMAKVHEPEGMVHARGVVSPFAWLIPGTPLAHGQEIRLDLRAEGIYHLYIGNSQAAIMDRREPQGRPAYLIGQGRHPWPCRFLVHALTNPQGKWAREGNQMFLKAAKMDESLDDDVNYGQGGIHVEIRQ